MPHPVPILPEDRVLRERNHVAEDLDGRIEMIVDGGPVEIGVESTILDMTVTPPMILRPGAVTREMLEELIGEVAVDQTLLRGRQQDRSEGSWHEVPPLCTKSESCGRGRRGRKGDGLDQRDSRHKATERGKG